MEQEYRYLVCTSCYTYNQASYIVDAMNGFANQETTFPVITLIVDDASTDGEPGVIRQYLADHFQTPYRSEETDDFYLICANHNTNINCTFVIFFLKYNHYSIKKPKLPYLSEWLENAKYQAICEGDDYWIYPKKLEKQVAYLEDNIEYSLCFTDKYILNNDKLYHDIESDKYLRSVSDYRSVVIDGGYIYTPTMLFRRSMFDKTPKAYLKHHWLMSDFQMRIELLHEGNFKYLPEITSVYRVLDNSASHFKRIERAIAFQESAYNARSYYCDYYDDMKEFQRWSDCYYCNMGLTIACRYHEWHYIRKYIKLAKDKGFLNISLIAKKIYVYIIAYPFVVRIRKFLTDYFFKKRHGLQVV